MTIVGIVFLVICWIVLAIIFRTAIEDVGNFEAGLFTFMIVCVITLASALAFANSFHREGEIQQLKGEGEYKMEIIYKMNDDGEYFPADTLYVKNLK